MSISSSVQFVGSGRVLKAFASRGVPSWAIFCNKQFMFKHEGSDINQAESVLRDTLEMLEGSRATYTLNVYEDLPKNAKIKSVTPYDGSFNFQLVDKSAIGDAGGGEALYILRQMKDDNNELRERLADLESRDIEGEIKPNLIGVVKEVMTIPGVTEIATAIIGKLFAPGPSLGRVGNIPESIESVYSDQMTDGEAQRLGEIYSVLRVKFPECLDLLQTLKDIAVNDPARFDSLKAMIKTFIK